MPEPPDPFTESLKAVLAHVEERLSDPLRLEELAALAGLSPTHFLRRFKAATGRTPRRHVIERRMARARKLLLESDLNLTDIAHATGFSSQSHLNATFARLEGRLPRSYRSGVG